MKIEYGGQYYQCTGVQLGGSSEAESLVVGDVLFYAIGMAICFGLCFFALILTMSAKVDKSKK